MTKIVDIHWRRFEKYLQSKGFVFLRQKGSHRIYSKEGLKRPLILTCHNTLPAMVIRTNLRTMGVDPEEYVKEIKKFK
jgi:predicted RNA binding protein YcfA (HicA-like mRNA interferase family)